MALFVKYIKNILISLDQLANTFLFGSPDECISTRLYKNYRGTWAEKFVNWLFRNPYHCYNSFKDEDDKEIFK